MPLLTEHCFIAFDDISSCAKIMGGIGWLAIRGNSSFPWILCMCNDWCGFCRQIYYLSWAAVKTPCRFTGKAVKRIFWNSSGTHSLWWRSRLRKEIHKRSQSLSTKVNRPFYDMVKIRVIIIYNVNIFTIYETLFESVITILPKTY